MSRKRRRDATSIDVELVEIYEDLAHESGDIRIRAAQTLLTRVTPGPKLSKQQLASILQRLFRGLCSGRKAARIGFSIALTEFLTLIYVRPENGTPAQLEIQEAIDTLLKQTTLSGNVSRQEVRDHDFGRLFGAEAIIQSGALSAPSVNENCWAQIIDIICGLAKSKAWLREECGWILYKTIGAIDDHTQHIQYILHSLNSHGLSKTPEGIAVWIAAQSVPSIQLPPAVWKHNNPLHHTEKTNIVRIVTETFTQDASEHKSHQKIGKKGKWSPNLHFAWDVLLSAFISKQQLNPQDETDSRELSLQDFWFGSVDDLLFSASASTQRKYWGFMVFEHALHKATTDAFPIIFSPNLMRCFMNQLASPDRYLHRIAERALNAILTRTDQEKHITTIIVDSLLRSQSGPVNFDQMTKTKSIQKLLSKAPDGALPNLFTIFSQLLAQPQTKDEAVAATSRRIAADQLVSIVKSRQQIEPNGSASFVCNVLFLFAEHGYLTCEAHVNGSVPEIDPPISASSRAMFRSRIASCMNHVLAKSTQPACIFYDLVTSIYLKVQNHKKWKLWIESDMTVGKTIDKAFMTLVKIHRKRLSSAGSRERLLSAFQLLYSSTFMQFYNGETEAVSILEDLKDSYKSLVKHKHLAERGNSDALVEILLSLLSRPSLLSRRLAQQVFDTCTSNVSKRGLHSIFKVLETKENVAGQEELFDVDNEEESSDSHTEHESNASTVGPGSENQSPAEATVDDEDAKEGDADEKLTDLNAKLACTLGTRPATDKLFDNGSECSSPEDMNDEQMEALDEQLGNFFRERQNQVSRRDQKEVAIESIVNFKCRALELLAVYVKHEHSNPLALELLRPLLLVLRTTRSSLLSTKVLEVVRRFSKLCTLQSAPRIAGSAEAMELFKDIHKQASRNGSKAYGTACSQASILLVKVLVAQDKENLRTIEDVYGQTHLEFVKGHSRSYVSPSFFNDWLNWSVTARKMQLFAC